MPKTIQPTGVTIPTSPADLFERIERGLLEQLGPIAGKAASVVVRATLEAAILERHKYDTSIGSRPGVIIVERIRRN